MDEIDFITDKTLLEILEREVGTAEKVEESESFIHVPAPGQEGKHKGHRIRYIDISKPKGIRAKYCGQCKVIISYVFTKAKGWTIATAVAWVKDHSKKKGEKKDWLGTPGVFGPGGGGVIAVPGEGPGPGVGGAEYCVCTSCGYREEHEKGKPCLEKKCPKCGKMMQGVFFGGVKTDLDTLFAQLKNDPSNESLIVAFVEALEQPKEKTYIPPERPDTWTQLHSDLLVAGLKYDEDLKIDLGYGTKAPAGFLGIDMRSGYGDITYNLEEGIPIPSNRASVIRAWHFLEFITNRRFIMEEIWSVLKDKGRFVFEVLSTRGQGAFANPNHRSFWNKLSFMFYVEDDLRASISTRAKFRIIELEERFNEEQDMVYVRGILEAVKSEEGPGELLKATEERVAPLDIFILAESEQRDVLPDESQAFRDVLGAKTKAPGFSIFKTVQGKDGKDYWLSISGSAFFDLEKEIISRAALDHAILFHDSTGIRGPLRIYHFKESDVGDCLISLRVRNFLIEAGSWYDSELAQSAKEWSGGEDADPAISVGFFFVPDDFVGNIYQKVIIFERSLVRAVDAACPWTLLRSILKEDKVGTKEQLAAIVGEDEAEKIVSQAETKSKELEEEGVAFKEVEGSEEPEEEVVETPAEETEEPEETPAEEVEVPEETPEVEPVPEVEEPEKEELKTVEELYLPEESVKALTDAFAEAIAPQLEALTTSVEEVGTRVTALEEDLGARVTELEKPISEKVKEELELQPKVVVSRATRSKETEAEPLVEVPDPSKEIDYSNETPQEGAERRGEFWGKRQHMPEEVDLGE